MKKNEGVVVTITEGMGFASRQTEKHIREILLSIFSTKNTTELPLIVIKSQIGNVVDLFSGEKVVLCEIKGRPSILVDKLEEKIRKTVFAKKVMVVVDSIIPISNENCKFK